MLAGDKKGGEYNPVPTIMHHISDANELHVYGDIHLPLPCILYSFDDGLDVFMSSAFHHGTEAVEGYVMNHGRVNRISTENFAEGHVALQATGEDEHGHKHYVEHEKVEGK